MTETFIALFLAHVFADYVLQPSWIVRNKRNPLVLLVHVAIVVATAQAATGHLAAPELLALGAAHLAIDAIKTYACRDTLIVHLGDQLAHIATIALVSLVAPGLWASGLWSGQPYVAPQMIIHAMLLAAGAIYAIRAGGIAVGYLMAPFGKALGGEAADVHAETGLPNGLPNGGLTIGLLERGLIFLLILVGQPAAIGFLIAAKSILRFSTVQDHGNRAATEYVIIGTLASFGWAIAVASATMLLAARLAGA